MLGGSLCARRRYRTCRRRPSGRGGGRRGDGRSCCRGCGSRPWHRGLRRGGSGSRRRSGGGGWSGDRRTRDRVAAYRVHDHVHLPALEERRALDDAVLLQLVADREQKHAAAVRMRELAAAEAHGDLELVAFVEKFRGRADLRVDVVVVDLGRDPDLLPRHGLLLLLGVLRLLLKVVAVLPEITHARHRRLDVGSDLDEVVALFLRLRERARGRDDPELLAIGTEKANGGNTDRFVDPQFGRGYRETSVIGVRTVLAARPLPVKQLQLPTSISPGEVTEQALSNLRPIVLRDTEDHARAQEAVGEDPLVPELALFRRAEACDRLL